jgi:hypothetical protein
MTKTKQMNIAIARHNAHLVEKLDELRGDLSRSHYLWHLVQEEYSRRKL